MILKHVRFARTLAKTSRYCIMKCVVKNKVEIITGKPYNEKELCEIVLY
jgi:hypothetical protein